MELSGKTTLRCVAPSTSPVYRVPLNNTQIHAGMRFLRRAIHAVRTASRQHGTSEGKTYRRPEDGSDITSLLMSLLFKGHPLLQAAGDSGERE